MSRQILNIILLTLCGLTGSLIIGFLFFQSSVFNINHPSSLFLFYGFYGAIFFSLNLYARKTELLVSLILVLITQILLMGKSVEPLFYLRDLVLISALFISVFIFVKLANKFFDINKSFLFRVLTFAVVYSFLNGIFGGILFILQTGSITPDLSIMIFYAQYALLIGFGLALGSLMYHFYLSKE